MIAPGVGVYAAGACNQSYHLHLPGCFSRQPSRAVEAVDNQVVLERHLYDLVEIRNDTRDGRPQVRGLIFGDIDS